MWLISVVKTVVPVIIYNKGHEGDVLDTHISERHGYGS